MNNDFRRDDPAPASNLAESPTALPANGANTNGASTNGAHAEASDPALRDALEDAHALFVRPAQGQGVARGMDSGKADDSTSTASSDYDPDDAYHRAMELSGDDAIGRNTSVASPADHPAQNLETEFAPSSIALPAAVALSGGSSGGGVVIPPSDNPPSSTPVPVPAPQHEEHEQDIWEHLGELRSRILKCVAAVAVAMVVTWQYRDAILETFASPIITVLKKHGGILTTIKPTDGFSMYLQTTFTAALLLVSPFVLYQVWAFIEPALTHKERRFSGILVPFSVILFFAGAAFGFYLTPVFFEWFFQFQPPNTSAFWTYSESTSFLAKMLLVFGICFQVPVITIFVNKIGLVSRNLLIEYWRHVVVLIFLIVAIITPSWDPVTMTAAALPPCLLYGVSIWLVKWL